MARLIEIISNADFLRGNSQGMTTVDYTSLDKMARGFEIAIIDNLVEILEIAIALSFSSFAHESVFAVR